MTIYLKQFEVIYPGHPLNGKLVDFLIEDGVCIDFGDNLDVEDYDVLLEDAKLSPGWFDVGTTLSSPGYEHRDTLETLAESAALGGFTDIAVLPNTQPVLDTAAQVKAIHQASEVLPISFHTIGAASKGCKGESLAEMQDLKQSGVVAYSDGHHPIDDAGRLLRTLQYAKGSGGLLINQPTLSNVTPTWHMHEGDVSIQLGLPGQSEVFEEIATNRDAAMAEYVGSKLLLHLLSSDIAIESVQDKPDVYTSVSYLNLAFTDEKLFDFDTNWKLNPPLRSDDIRQALVEQVNNEKIDIICTNHTPLDPEATQLEFSEAEFGCLSLQNVYPVLTTMTPELSEERLVQCLAINPREILNLPLPKFEKGEPFVATLFDPNQETTFSVKENASKSVNSPFFDQTMKGKIIGIFAKGNYIPNL